MSESASAHLAAFGEHSLKSFIKKNYPQELELAYEEQRKLGYEQGKEEALLSLKNDQQALLQLKDSLSQQAIELEQKKRHSEQVERAARAKVDDLLGCIESTEEALLHLRQETKADVIYVLSQVFHQIYPKDESQQRLVQAIEQELDNLASPCIRIEVSDHCLQFIRDNASSEVTSQRLKGDAQLKDSEVKIYTNGLCIYMDTDKNKQVLKQNLQACLDEL